MVNIETSTSCIKVLSLLVRVHFYCKLIIIIRKSSCPICPSLGKTQTLYGIRSTTIPSSYLTNCKQALLSTHANIYQDNPTLVTTDALRVASVPTSVREYTVAFASRTLSATELAYYNSESKALASSLACEHLH